MVSDEDHANHGSVTSLEDNNTYSLQKGLNGEYRTSDADVHSIMSPDGMSDSRDNVSGTTFTVLVRRRRFELSRAQVLFDTPNYFSNAFLSGGFAESSTRTLVLDRNPDLFSLIVEYLSGYAVLPLDSRVLPPTMGVDAALRNLAVDAEYFELRGLAAQLEIPTPPPTPPRSPTLEPGSLPSYAKSLGFAPRTLSLQDLLSDNLPEGLRWTQGLNSLVDEQGHAVIVHAKGINVSFTTWKHLAIDGRRPPGTISGSEYKVYPDNELFVKFELPRVARPGRPYFYGRPHSDAALILNSSSSQPTFVPAHALSAHLDGSTKHLASADEESAKRMWSAALASPLWADEVYFTVPERREVEWPQNARRVNRDYYNVRILSLHARTRPAALGLVAGSLPHRFTA